MRTMTVRPLRRLVTRTMVPNGNVRCAAVSLDGENVSPFEVLPAWVQIVASCGLSPATADTTSDANPVAKTTAQAAIRIADLIMRRVPCGRRNCHAVHGDRNRVPAARFPKGRLKFNGRRRPRLRTPYAGFDRPACATSAWMARQWRTRLPWATTYC